MVSLKLKLLFLLLYLNLSVQSLARLASSLLQVFTQVGYRSIAYGSIAYEFKVYGSIACGYIVYGFIVPVGVPLDNGVIAIRSYNMLQLRPYYRQRRSLIRICRHSIVDFSVFLSITVRSLVVFHQVKISCLYSGPLKQLYVALYSLLKGILRGLLLRLVQQWLSARLRSIVE